MSKPARLLLIGVHLFIVGCSGNSSTIGGTVPGGTLDGGRVEDDGAAPASPDGGASSTTGSWSLSGTIRGVDLQEDARSAIAERIDDGTSIRTSVTVANLDGYCARTQKDASCAGQGSPHRMLVVTIQGTKPGTYSVTNGDAHDPPAGQAGVAFMALGESCEMLASPLKATSGSVTFTKIDLAKGGVVALSLDISTSEGPVSGTITAPACD